MYKSFVSFVCSYLRNRGFPILSERIQYYSTDEDLEEDDVPLTLESLQGFFTFFSTVKEITPIHITCSPEGWICATWKFHDTRRIVLWFVNSTMAMYGINSGNGYIYVPGSNGESAPLENIRNKLLEIGLMEENCA